MHELPDSFIPHVQTTGKCIYLKTAADRHRAGLIKKPEVCSFRPDKVLCLAAKSSIAITVKAVRKNEDAGRIREAAILSGVTGLIMGCGMRGHSFGHLCIRG